jgi:two-component system, NtrC family, sensor kinase
MQRRGASGQLAKRRRTPKARKAPADHSPEQFDHLKREHDETLQQLAATSEVLRVIRRSPTDVQPVFDMIAESAARLCAAQFCFVYRFDGQLLYFVAHHSVTPEMIDINRRAYPQPPSRGSVAARAILEKSVVQIPDVNADPDYTLGGLAAVGGYRSAIGIPILRDGLPIGSIAVTRAQAGLFPNRQVELLKTFAEPAVIAIENVRLFNETKEALERQTATSEVLTVISRSPGQLEPVFNAMLANATRICEAEFGNLFLRDGSNFRAVAVHGKESYADQWRRDPVVDLREHPLVPLARVTSTKQVLHIPDLRTDQSYIGQDSRIVPLVEVAGARTFLQVPMLKDDEIVGTIGMYRQEMRPFTDKQIELVQNFAAQAVIAIENTRLLNELRQRTDDLTESLEQQTATSEVLQIISSSPGELEPVFNTMLQNAVRICDAKFGHLWLREGDALRIGATHGAPSAFVDYLRNQPVYRPKPKTGLGELMRAKKTFHLADVAALPTHGDKLREATINLAGARTLVGVPMLKENEVIGAIVIYRQEVRPFTDKQIELLTNFAAQAVIAIENTRLLSELRESLQQQTATADVLKVISSSPGDLGPVFETMLANAVRICEANFGVLFRSQHAEFTPRLGPACRPSTKSFFDDAGGFVRRTVPLSIGY